MPSRAFIIASDVDGSRVCVDVVRTLINLDDSDAEELAGLLLLAFGQPMVQRLQQHVGRQP